MIPATTANRSPIRNRGTAPRPTAPSHPTPSDLATATTAPSRASQLTSATAASRMGVSGSPDPPPSALSTSAPRIPPPMTQATAHAARALGNTTVSVIGRRCWTGSARHAPVHDWAPAIHELPTRRHRQPLGVTLAEVVEMGLALAGEHVEPGLRCAVAVGQ